MTASIRGPVGALKTFLLATGRFSQVNIGESTDVPGSHLCEIILARYWIPETTFTGPVEVRGVNIRIYVPLEEIQNLSGEPAATNPGELELDDIVSSLYTSFLGDFNLGGTIRGIAVTQMTATFGYLRVSDTGYRIVEIFLPMIIDDSAVFVP